jgi:hypothetical protein
VRDAIESGGDLRGLAASWRRETREFQREVAAHRLYRE